MKKLLMFILSILSLHISLAQINQYDRPATYTPQNTYVSPDLDELTRIALIKKQMMDNNAEYYNSLIGWIKETKAKNIDIEFQRKLTEIENRMIQLTKKDLSTINPQLKIIENDIAKAFDEYIVRKKKQNDPNTVLDDFSNSYKNGEYESALNKISQLIQQDSQNEQLYVLRSQCYYNMRDFEYALLDLNKAIQINPSFSDAYGFRGWCYIQQGINDLAISSFEKEITLSPNNADAYFGKGYALSSKGLLEKANADYLKSIALDPNKSMTYNNLGWNYFKLNNNVKALEYVNKALEKDTRNSIAWDSRGEINFTLKNYSQAVLDCNRAIAIDPNSANSYLIRGRSNYILGNKVFACDDFKKAGDLGKFEAFEFIDKYCTGK